MKRDLDSLSAHSFDLVVIGGGIFGACCAWDAVLRGLSVALVERADFGGQTSANCFKMIHGGIRYMQHADIVRVRESCHERSALLRIAPHLVEPLPIAIPTYGIGKNGKLPLAAGMWGYDALTLDRNRGIADPNRRVPFGRFLSRSELLADFPGVARANLTGAAVFHDAQMYNPARLVLAFLRSAAERGVALANYVTAEDLVIRNGKVEGLVARDGFTDERFTIRAGAVLNAAGPFSETLFKDWLPPAQIGSRTYSRDACFIVRRRFASRLGIALMGESHDSDAVMARDARHLFVAPWRDTSLVGVWHKVHRDDPRDVRVDPSELAAFIAEINGTYPGLDLDIDDVRLWHAGLLPFGDQTEDGKSFSYGKRSVLIDHASEHGIGGLVSLIGIRYTMGRGDAARAVDLLLKGLDRKTARPATERLPIYGGDFEIFEDVVSQVRREAPGDMDEAVARALAHNYGSCFRHVLANGGTDEEAIRPLGGSTVTAAEIRHAVRDEMAITLSDIVFRRTDLGTAGHPGTAALEQATAVAGDEFGWDPRRCADELATVAACFPAFPQSSEPQIRAGRGAELANEAPA
mgnify:CR=1 FL=1